MTRYADNRVVKASREYGGVWRTWSPELNFRCWIGGLVHLGRIGKTCKNVEGGMRAVKRL